MKDYNKVCLRGFAYFSLLVCLFYTVVYIMQPYWGVTFTRVAGGWLVVKMDGEEELGGLAENDVILEVDGVPVGNSSVMSLNKEQGNELLVRRAGKLLTVQWRPLEFPLFGYVARVLVILFIAPFWLAGAAVVFWLPKREGYPILAFTFLGYAMWVAAGLSSQIANYAGSEIMHGLTWLLVPTVILLHWTIPYPITQLRKSTIIGIYIFFGLTVIVTYFWWRLQMIYTALLIQITISVALLIWRGATNRGRRTSRIMLLGLVMAFAPGILWSSLIAMNAKSSQQLTAISLMTFLLWPVFYLYASYRGILEEKEVRWRNWLWWLTVVNVYINLIFLMVSSLGIWLDWDSFARLGVLAVTVIFGGIMYAAHSRLSRSLYGLLGGDLENAIDRCVEKFSHQMTKAVADYDFSRVLRQMADDMGISNMALHIEGDGFVVWRGADIPENMEPGELEWARLTLPIEIKGRVVGSWILGAWAGGNFYSMSAKAKLQTLANQIAAAMEIEQQRILVERQAQQMLAEERMVAMGRMGAEIAHQFNGPLMVIRSAILAHNNNTAEGLPVWLAMAYERLEELGGKVAEITKFVRPVQSPDVVMVDVNEAVTTALTWAKPLIKERELALTTKLMYELPEVLTWPTDLPDALFNLIKNACESMMEGGLLDVETYQENGWVVVTITDTGCGIPENDMAHLFDPFFTRKEQGSGFGLPIAWAIIERGRGRIDVDSAVGQGSTMTVRLPMGDAVDRGHEGIVLWRKYS